MDINSVDSYSKIVKSFARDTPSRLKFTDFEYTIYSYEWVIPWIKEYFLVTEFLTISFTIIFFNIIMLLSFYIVRNKTKTNFFNNIHFIVILILIFNLIIWMNAPEIRFGYGTIISLFAFSSALVLKKFRNVMVNKFLFYIIISFIFIPLSIKNKINLRSYENNSFVRNFDYSKFEIIYKTNEHNIYRPSDNFCNAFEGFCTYQGYKVSINKENNYLFMKQN
tara:strand:+ start:111 stop:776 length:666 start_codon:yes stop_codon:yes gene_type:complete